MLAILASLVIAASGAAAIGSIVVTVLAQSAAMRQVIADARLIARDREFLVRLTEVPAGNARVTVGHICPAPRYAISRWSDAEVLLSEPLREAA
jgi:hypothetical protein